MRDINIIFSKGNPSLNPVIFIHGDFQNHTSLKPIAELLKSKTHTTLSFDIPGHGLSKLSTETENLISILESIVKEKNITNPTIIGHSFGTVLASTYAKRNKVSSLILISPILSNFKSINPEMNFETFTGKFIETCKKVFKGQELIDYSDSSKSLGELQKLGFETTKPEGIINNVSITQSLPLQDDIHKFDFPILLIASKEDSIIPILYVKELQQKAKLAKLEIIKGGHNSQITNPQGIIDAIHKNYKFLFGQ